MTRTRSLPILLSVSLAGLALAACGDDHDTAEFAGADDAHLRRSVEVVRAGDLASLYVIGVFTSGANSTGCPSMATEGAVTTISGGCTNDDGVRIEGRMVVTNVPPAFSSNPAVDPSKAGTVEAIAFTASDGVSTNSIDGVVTITPRDGSLDNGGTLVGDLDVTTGGIAARSVLSYSCDSTDLCDVTGDSWVGIDTVGEAVVTGQFRFDDPATGSITATGADTLVIDVAASTDDCITFSIDGGTARQFCSQEQTARVVRGSTRLLRQFHLADRLR